MEEPSGEIRERLEARIVEEDKGVDHNQSIAYEDEDEAEYDADNADTAVSREHHKSGGEDSLYVVFLIPFDFHSPFNFLKFDACNRTGRKIHAGRKTSMRRAVKFEPHAQRCAKQSSIPGKEKQLVTAH